ncbi:Transcriptional regulator, LysR family [Cronobacter condimenti 1330]|uniref:LysR family transcriptional regulator n=1 Tax=Cronobacter condimenti 1330 TaxID=1073999 RepID=K7ZXS6_9ENTR|nr:LysR family transcriptional regulator [Cronobacter condimenti]ALB64746.1 LysR family transcriptional regulator [Cronobacter condimenti 1330]CCJ70690.1 Transcriptional regulator, LysR family [Cronobacter condimenti 1330]
MQPDLNDYFYYAEVVNHGGFAAASRALKQPKSKLSRRVAGLEAQLGVRLIERSSRRFRVTDIGQAFYEKCRAMLLEAEKAQAVIAQARKEPQGVVRFSCPTGLVEIISATLPVFMNRYPQVKLQIIAIDRPVDLIEERVDIALRVRTELTSDTELIMRSLGTSSRILVASPRLASQLDSEVDALTCHPTLGTSDEPGEITWALEHAQGKRCLIRHAPRLSCADFTAIRAAAIAGLGIALLPDHVCAQALKSGELVHVYRGWQGQRGIVHLVFTTRRGLPPAVRAFIDHLATHFPLTTSAIA